ncbi:MAG: hypothetical protein JSV18_01060 [Candidatus Bathyarchaeota archaeon]|nr:MAG: hypothetical protein JSV18_01060 [Candidatus Bathyarchaeota archaeon]
MGERNQQSKAGIKRLEKKGGRLWGFLVREEPGKVTPLTSERTTRRLRHLMMSSTKTTGSYMRSQMSDERLKELFEFQAEEFANAWRRGVHGADQIARDLIRYNFQPFGMEAEYSGDREVARIVVSKCPLPQRFLQDPEFLSETSFESGGKNMIENLRFFESLSAKGEWPPKNVEVCAVCKIVLPEIGGRLGFNWEYAISDDQPPKCLFTVSVKPRKS